nr:thioesterase [Longispora sp. (in: high G+C Gram-positive bacteria)]
GVHVEFAHLAPSVVGRLVQAEAILREVDGRNLIFSVELTDGETVVAEATIKRMLVDRHRFVEKAHGIC